MSQWYRDALGIVETTIKSGQRTRLTIRVPWQPWGSIRAACQHPDVVACIGTRLGVIGAWLGLIGLVPPAFISRGVKADEPMVGSAQLAVAAILGLVGWLACSGVSRSPS
jgi:hypothetical protein